MDAQTQIKLMHYDKLIDELRSLKTMYLSFSNKADNIISSSAFHIIAKDLETLLERYGNKS